MSNKSRSVWRFVAVAAVISFAGFAVPSGALAKAAPRACNPLKDVSPAAVKCDGWFAGNLLNEKSSNLTSIATDLNTLLGVTSYTKNNDDPIAELSDLAGGDTTTIDFGKTLFGDTVVGFHNGAAKGEPNNIGAEGTAFFLLDFTVPTKSFILDVPGSSNAWLFSTQTAAPEPATWAMMLAGLALVGGALRLRRLEGAGSLPPGLG